MTRRALVTGAGGFVGRHVIAELERCGYEVKKLRFQFSEAGTTPTVLFDRRVRSTDDIVDIVAEYSPTTILHLAGTKRSAFLTEINVGVALRLIAALRQTGVTARLTLIGSAAEYGHVDEKHLPVREDHPCAPLTPYGMSKHAQTLIGLAAAQEGLDVVVARCFNLVGSGMPNGAPLMEIASRIIASKSTGKVMVGNLDVERDFVDAADAARCLVNLAELPSASGQVINVCTGQGHQLLKVVESLAQTVSPPPQLLVDPNLTDDVRVRRMVGNPDRLNGLGLAIMDPDFAALADVIMRDVSPGTSF